MKVSGWKYYNHAAIPDCEPHEEPDLKPIENGSVWKMDRYPLLARWTSDWDCKRETEWWYEIKDEPFDISKLKSKRRYEITKGNRNFNVVEIDTSLYVDELLNVTKLAYEAYPKSYRPEINIEKFTYSMKKPHYFKTYGAFSYHDNALCGYIQLDKTGQQINLIVMKAIPMQERNGINAAMIYKVLSDLSDHLKYGYICDGHRSINHETAFQDYLEKYFGFRKAYCNLHIRYRTWFGIVMGILKKGQCIINKFNKNKIGHMITVLLEMDRIARTANEK